MNKLAVMINPVSGGGRGDKVWQVLSPGLRALFDEVEYRVTNKVDDLQALTRQLLANEPDYLLAIGGDGTLNHVVNGMLDNGQLISPKTQFAFYNAGCGGDFIRQFPEQHITDFLEHLKMKKTYAVNLGKITFADQRVHYFINIASCGLSASVATATQQSKWFKRLGGTVNYFVHSLLGVLRYRSVPVEIQMDDNPPFSCKMLLMAVANGQYFGGKMYVAPMAKIDDDLLDVVIFHDFTKLAALWKLRKIYTGNHLHERQVHYVQAKKVRISSLDGQPIWVEGDGEVVGRVPVSFELLPEKLNVVV